MRKGLDAKTGLDIIGGLLVRFHKCKSLPQMKRRLRGIQRVVSVICAAESVPTIIKQQTEASFNRCVERVDRLEQIARNKKNFRPTSQHKEPTQK